ncbi:MAG: hypothetical protein HZC11_01830 [Nitrospirae bacterium]|nr:hypothetical protein [Nitrospirota bacterium]
MLCVAECPSGGLEINSFNFYSAISKLRKVPLPVMGCNIREDIKAHVNTFCMGYLSEEHLIALLVFLDTPLQLNLTGCKTCKNSFIVDVLKKRLELVETKIFSTQAKACDYTLHATRYTLNKITLVEDKSALRYEDVPFDRRGFFGTLKGLAMEGAANFLDSAADQKQMSAYGDKVLPFKRRVLNKALSVMIESNTKDNKTSVSQRGTTGNENVIPTQVGIQRKEELDSCFRRNDAVGGLSNKILKNYYYNLVVDDNCDMCFACVGMCPTGALKEPHVSDDEHGENAPRQLLFNASFCNGCGLCSDFCVQSSISIKRGFSENPFEEKCMKKVNNA